MELAIELCDISEFAEGSKFKPNHNGVSGNEPGLRDGG